jgi:hypothetical protein
LRSTDDAMERTEGSASVCMVWAGWYLIFEEGISDSMTDDIGGEKREKKMQS